ncbi:hypothetical protein LIER_02798 [Lithospermum erythrorhizon]|uniref:BZIP domain-containing protein n=1 Tax=Lithospermum erythrorhizon TaxID=34254 RepID=A0AAV3NRY6_LITER
MENPYTKEEIITQLSSCNGHNEYMLELNEDDMQQLLHSIDDIMRPENIHCEADIINNQSITPEEVSNTTTAFLQNFEEFEKSYLSACGSGNASIDPSILQDFEVFEKAMLPPICHGDMDNVDDDLLFSNDGGEGTEDDVMEMVNEMADDGNDDFLVSNDGGKGTEEDISEMVNEMVDDGSETINFIEEEEDDLITFYFDGSDYDEYDFGWGGGAGGGVDPLLAPHGGAKRVHYIKCSGETRRQKQNGIRERKKRKYRGVIETEEQTAKRLEITKIRNREAATKTIQRKKEYDAYLQAQLKKLRWKNKYLKNFIKLLECPKGKNMQLQPLRRTLSGLM